MAALYLVNFTNPLAAGSEVGNLPTHVNQTIKVSVENHRQWSNISDPSSRRPAHCQINLQKRFFFREQSRRDWRKVLVYCEWMWGSHWGVAESLHQKIFSLGQIKRKDGDQANRDGMQLFPQLNCQNTSRCELSANTSLFPPHPPPSTPWKISKASLRFIPECFGLSEDLAQTCLGRENTLCYTGWGV